MHFPHEKKFLINFLVQPKLFYLIFFIELWERFGYYGLQSILVIYLVKKFSFSESEAIFLFSAFNALTYSLVPIGGWLGDKVIGPKLTIIISLIILIIGYSMIIYSDYNQKYLYTSLSIIAVGSGLFKSNPSSLLSTCYSKFDSRIDSAFTMYYISINLGSFFSMILVPWLVVCYGWKIAFLSNVFGITVTFFIFVFFKNFVETYNSSFNLFIFKFKNFILVSIGILFLILFSNWILHHPKIINWIISIFIFLIFLFLFYETSKLDSLSKKHMLAVIVMILEAVVFFIIYNQNATSLNLFTIHNVNTSILGKNFLPEQFQALNPLFIILLGPVVSIFLSRTGKSFAIPLKFSIGMLFCSLSFLLISFGTHFYQKNGIVSVFWIILFYALQGIGELIVSGLGLSVIARLIKRKLMGFVMGVWFLSISASTIIAGKIASFSAISQEIYDPLFSIEIYSKTFMKIGIFTLLFSLLIFIFSSKLSKLFYEK